MRAFRGVLAVLIAAAMAAGGAGYVAAAAPASAPQTLPAVDMSSPKATLASVYAAMRRGDVEGIKQCLIFEGPQEAELFEIELTRIWGPLKLMRALQAKFGDAAKKPFGGAALEQQLDEQLARLEKVEITIAGDTATLGEKKAAVNPDAENELTGVTLKKQDGKWRVVAESFSDIGSDVKPEQLQMMRALRAGVVQACTKTAARLEAGEFKSVDEAYAAYQAAVQQATRAAAGGGGTKK
jgi:hypothetical protein